MQSDSGEFDIFHVNGQRGDDGRMIAVNVLAGRQVLLLPVHLLVAPLKPVVSSFCPCEAAF
jgi:hypothetical protein